MYPNPFLETLQSHPDAKLKEMVERKRHDYQPMAIAAAEEILRKRKVKFTEAAPEENVEMTYDEIKADIRVRLSRGEQMPEIREYYRECGVDIDAPEIKEYDADVTHASNLYSLRIIGGIIGGVAAVFMALNESTDGASTRWVFYILAGIAVVMFVLSFRKK